MLKRFFQIADTVIDIHRIKKAARKTTELNYFKNEFRSNCTSFLNTDDIYKIKNDANRILDGEYQIYNFEPYKNIKWNQDPISGRTIKNSFVVDLIRTSNLHNKVDIKNIWEQSHLHPLVTLAQCYELFGDLRCAYKIVDILMDFYYKNPCGQSVAWKCCMDSAIRLANIVNSISKISNTPCYKENEIIIIQCIYEHVLFISKNYEDKGKYTNNHYLSDLIGVIWGSVYLYKNYNVREMLDLYDETMDRLNKEAHRQILSDGFDYELSTYYHCFVTELLTETLNMLIQNECVVPVELSDITTKMLGCCKELGAFEGGLPLIGDQDGSRLFHLKGCFDIDRCNFSTLDRFSNSPEGEVKEFGNIYVLSKDNIKVFFKCGAIGTSGKGTHDHNDQLSVCVYIDNVEIICDSGTYCYTRDLKKRKKYRSVQSHSTVHFIDQEQNDISDVFSIKSKQYGKLVRYETDLVEGEFIYENMEKHKRVVSINSGILTIEDEAVDGISRLVLPISYSKIRRIDDFHICFSCSGIEVFISSEDIIEIKKASISRSYGTEAEAVYVDSKCNGKHFYYIKRGTNEYDYSTLAK